MTASVRNRDKAQQVLKTHPSWEGKITFGFVPELNGSGVFDALFDKPYDFVLHAASPVTFQIQDVQQDLIDPAVQG